MGSGSVCTEQTGTSRSFRRRASPDRVDPLAGELGDSEAKVGTSLSARPRLDTESLHLTLQLEADVTNVSNTTYFSLASTATQWNTCAAGLTTIQQCAANAYGTIGGQNANVPPRDWQFAGRFRF